jgi:hypothetical protein
MDGISISNDIYVFLYCSLRAVAGPPGAWSAKANLAAHAQEVGSMVISKGTTGRAFVVV